MSPVTPTGRARSRLLGVAAGVAVLSLTAAGNRSIIIHAEETHPDGTAGARLACLPLVWMP